MKFGRKLTLAAGAAATVTLVLAASYGVGLATYHANFSAPFKAPYTKGHATAAAEDVNSGQCVKCHRTSIPGTALRGGRSVHTSHNSSIFLTFGRTTKRADGTDAGVKTGCTLCHPDTGTSNYQRVSGTSKNAPISYEGDVSYADSDDYDSADEEQTTQLRKHVNPGFCLRCHGSLVESSNHVGTLSCRTSICHGSLSAQDPTTRHDEMAWIKTVKVPGTSDQKCRLCHGGKQWYQDVETNPADESDSANTP